MNKRSTQLLLFHLFITHRLLRGKGVNGGYGNWAMMSLKSLECANVLLFNPIRLLWQYCIHINNLFIFNISLYDYVFYIFAFVFLCLNGKLVKSQHFSIHALGSLFSMQWSVRSFVRKMKVGHCVCVCVCVYDCLSMILLPDQTWAQLNACPESFRWVVPVARRQLGSWGFGGLSRQLHFRPCSWDAKYKNPPIFHWLSSSGLFHNGASLSWRSL